mgnify:CR=1 FL=1
MEPILKVSDLTKTFEDRKRENFSAVDHVSFHVMPGQTLGIVGESGSGKSTTGQTSVLSGGAGRRHAFPVRQRDRGKRT